MTKRKSTRVSATRRSAPDPPGALDVVVLAGSAGCQSAVLTILRLLPADFPIPLILLQHLSPNSDAVNMYARHARLGVEWFRPGAALEVGKVWVCPPRSFVELLPDGTCVFSACERGANDKPIDRLLDSVARSFGPRGVGVILSGMGADGADGARQLHLAGGSVVVQSEASAPYPSMPRATIQAGAADVILPHEQIAGLLIRLAQGRRIPRAPSEQEEVEALFKGPGDARALMRTVDWARTALGPVSGWPDELKLMVRNVMASSVANNLLWGPELIQIHNDAAVVALGGDNVFAAKPFQVAWPEMWPAAGPQFESVLRTGQSIHAKGVLFALKRYGVFAETYYDYDYTPVHDSQARVVGILEVFTETTARVLAFRRLNALRDLGTLGANASPSAVIEAATGLLGKMALDVPVALFYRFDKPRQGATLAGAVGVSAGSPFAPHVLSFDESDPPWPLAELAHGGPPRTLTDLSTRLPDFHAAPWPEPLVCAALHPLRKGSEGAVMGAVVLCLSPRLRDDPTYAPFLASIAQQISSALGEAEARLLEHERAEQLSELDRIKTEFFANVSHEFRTPLTLMLAPLEELLQSQTQLSPPLANALRVATRNARRLSTLVNSLLDFSQLESRHQRASLELVDLGALTADIASAFRSAIDSAGLTFRVECDPRLPPVLVNRELWESIVSNLLSNALKFTFKGEIVVELRAKPLHAQLLVSDSGIGIPESEMPNLFKRFHRVRGAHGRTAEGAGIGLSLVHDAVRRMGGQIRAVSRKDHGTAFTVWLSSKPARIAQAAPGPSAERGMTPRTAAQLADEAARWLADVAEPEGVIADLTGAEHAEPPGARALDAARQRIVVADDNADMRDYLHRILSPYWHVESVADGERALVCMREARTDLLLADVMMPKLDGFALLRAVRADAALKTMPVILVTARADEQSAIDGLLAGADDHIPKPFSPRELVARVGGQLALARMRRRTRELNDVLIQFSDVVRGLTDAQEVARIACRMAAEQLGAPSACWAELDWATREYVVERQARYPFEAWASYHASYLAGASVILDDAQADPHVSGATKAILVRHRLGALLSAPVMMDGTLRATLSVNHPSPHHWSPEEIALVEGLASRCGVEVERARAEAARRESEQSRERFAVLATDTADRKHAEELQRTRQERQDFLLGLSDALCLLSDARDIQETASRLTGEHFARGRAARAGFAPGGRWRMEDFGTSLRELLLAGREILVDDAASDPRIPPPLHAIWNRAGVCSALAHPFVKQGRLVASFFVLDERPRRWTGAEVDLLREAAERTWATLERAHTGPRPAAKTKRRGV